MPKGLEAHYVQGWLGARYGGEGWGPIAPSWRIRPGDAPQLTDDDYKGLLRDSAWADFTGLFAWGTYWVILRGSEVGGVLVPVGIDVRSYGPAETVAPLTSGGTLRSFPLAEMLGTLRAQYARTLDLLTEGKIDPTRAVHPHVAAVHTPEEFMRMAAARDLEAVRKTDQPRRRGRPSRSPDHYQQVAEVYKRAVLAGLPPRLEIAAHWKVTPSTASKWIAKARELDHLPQTAPGVQRGTSIDTNEKEE